MRLPRLLNVLPLLYLFGMSSAHAQIGMVAIRGVVQQFDPPTLIVKTADGEEEHIRLSERFQMTTLSAANAADIAPGRYVGITAKSRADGKLVATDVRLFSDEMRGAGEGHLSVRDGITITNGTVGNVVKTRNGRDLTLHFNAADMKFFVPKGVSVFAVGSADRGSLKPGARVSITAVRRPSGMQTASRVTLEFGLP